MLLGNGSHFLLPFKIILEISVSFHHPYDLVRLRLLHHVPIKPLGSHHDIYCPSIVNTIEDMQGLCNSKSNGDVLASVAYGRVLTGKGGVLKMLKATGGATAEDCA